MGLAQRIRNEHLALDGLLNEVWHYAGFHSLPGMEGMHSPDSRCNRARVVPMVVVMELLHYGLSGKVILVCAFRQISVRAAVDHYCDL